ncbi:hypothetical protein FLP41_20610 [Paracoccus marcusii]|nr:hypothetical protein FLP41_20610 [Paracoccus marcusii]
MTAFRLAPIVASSPLLMSLSRDLCGRSMSDDRRFAFSPPPLQEPECHN